MHTLTRAPDNDPHPPPHVTPYFRGRPDWAAIDAAVAAERRRRLSVA